MKKRKIPVRKSVISNKNFPKKELLRIVRNQNNQVVIDPTGKASGRGAYLSYSLEEVAEAQRKKVFERIFKVEIPDQFYDELMKYVEHILARRELFKEDEENTSS
jgi:predicted RNA-binding protein YlxR (DUF448 family)